MTGACSGALPFLDELEFVRFSYFIFFFFLRKVFLAKTQNFALDIMSKRTIGGMME